MFYLQSFSLYFSISIFKYFIEEKEKKKVKLAFQHYLNPNVINQLIENPDKLKLGGEKKFLTVFFSDVRGFTTISETLSPEKLTSLLNEYFTPQVNTDLETLIFRQASQHQGESIGSFFIRLKALSAGCKFGDKSQIENQIKLQILQTCLDKRIKVKAAQENMTLDAVLKFAQALVSGSKALNMNIYKKEVGEPRQVHKVKFKAVSKAEERKLDGEDYSFDMSPEEES
jgi:hypothetical protein